MPSFIMGVLLLALVVRPIQATNYLPNCAGLKDSPPAQGEAPSIGRAGSRSTLLLPPGDYFVPPAVDGHGSMVPVANWGHFLVVRRASWTEVVVNQYILFTPSLLEPFDLKGTVAIFHQVIGFGEDATGPFAWTRGIANCFADLELVRPEQLLGIVVAVWWGG